MANLAESQGKSMKSQWITVILAEKTKNERTLKIGGYISRKFLPENDVGQTFRING
jgi:hypothetical protein